MPPKLDDDPLPWKVLASEYESRKFWYTVRRDRVELPNGTVIPEYWINEYLPWVNVVAVTADDKILLVRQYRHGSQAVHFEIPAGTTDATDTDIETAGRRELLEETGHGGGRWSPLMTLSANPALQNNLTYTFLAEGVVPMQAADPGAGEDLRLHQLPANQIESMIERGEMIQSLHVAPLLKYLLQRQRRG
jgi:8-oxo-dGTP pyrophosphatase MutT (NUDIX family)